MLIYVLFLLLFHWLLYVLDKKVPPWFWMWTLFFSGFICIIYNTFIEILSVTQIFYIISYFLIIFIYPHILVYLLLYLGYSTFFKHFKGFIFFYITIIWVYCLHPQSFKIIEIYPYFNLISFSIVLLSIILLNLKYQKLVTVYLLRITSIFLSFSFIFLVRNKIFKLKNIFNFSLLSIHFNWDEKEIIDYFILKLKTFSFPEEKLISIHMQMQLFYKNDLNYMVSINNLINTEIATILKNYNYFDFVIIHTYSFVYMHYWFLISSFLFIILVKFLISKTA